MCKTEKDVIMYLRKSRSEELTDTTEETLRRHKEQLEALAKRQQLHVILTYEEVVSGESLYARPEMLKVLEAAETKKYYAVLVMDIDRLGRGSMAEQGIIFDTFRRANCRIITPDKTYDLSNESDEEITELQSFIARRELKMIKKRLHRGIIKTVEDGGYIPNAPFGYRKTVVNRLPTLEVYEPEAKYVRMIFDMYVNQNVGSKTISDHLNSLGITPSRSDHFERSSITLIIKNPVYIGKVVWDSKKYVKTKEGARHSVKTPENKKVIDGIHPAIIDEETFNRAQEILNKQWHKKYFDGVIKNPLSGLVFCGNCGRRMTRHPSGGHIKSEILLCPTAGCIPSSKLADVEEAVLSSVKEQLRDIDVRIKGVGVPDTSVFDKSIASAEEELKKSSSQMSKIHELLEQGVYTVETFLERRSEIERRSDALTSYIKEQQALRDNVIDSDLSVVSTKIHNVLDSYFSADSQGKCDLLRSIIESITYYKDSDWKTGHLNLIVKLKYI